MSNLKRAMKAADAQERLAQEVDEYREERLERELEQALEADGEKLRGLTGQDHGPFDNIPAGEPTDRCIDCDGAGTYPSGATCKSCGGSGRVLKGDGEPDDDFNDDITEGMTVVNPADPDFAEVETIEPPAAPQPHVPAPEHTPYVSNMAVASYWKSIMLRAVDDLVQRERTVAERMARLIEEHSAAMQECEAELKELTIARQALEPASAKLNKN